jgi:signal transduction histidine kinase
MAAAEIRVLFVEDSESDSRLAVRALTLGGFSPVWERVDTAAGLRDAIERQPWHVVLSDSSVPRLPPLEALALVRELAPGLPFIVLSGTISEESAVQAIRSGAADYVTKDNLGRLGPAVTGALATSRARVATAMALSEPEIEMRRIAHGLHDELGQLLTALRLTLESAQRARGTEGRERLSEALALVDQAMERTRDLSTELWPSVLDDLGLPAALRWMAERHARWSGLEFELDLDPVERQSPGLEVACFRIAQEALTNVARHATARTVAMRLRGLPGGIALEIRDDGAGFDIELASRRTTAGVGLGLVGMRMRAAQVGGRLEIESRPGQGTAVRAQLPIAPDAAP